MPAVKTSVVTTYEIDLDEALSLLDLPAAGALLVTFESGVGKLLVHVHEAVS